MDISLSTTWIAIRIGKSEYCINSEYVTGVSELEKAEYKNPVPYSSLIKGVYKVFGANMHVLDGRRLLGYTTIDEEKLNFSEDIHSIKYRHQAWLDDLEWSILTDDKFTKTLDVNKSELGTWIRKADFKDDRLNNIVKRILEPLKVIFSLGKKALGPEVSADSNEAHNLVEEIKRQSEKYIIKGLDNLIEANNSKIKETCIAIRCKGVDFGISADTIVSISEQSGKIGKACRDRLSAGTVTIKDREYNIINLTKITNLMKSQEGSL